MTRNRYYGGLFLFSLEISINNSYGSQQWFEHNQLPNSLFVFWSFSEIRWLCPFCHLAATVQFICSSSFWSLPLFSAFFQLRRDVLFCTSQVDSMVSLDRRRFLQHMLCSARESLSNAIQHFVSKVSHCACNVEAFFVWIRMSMACQFFPSEPILTSVVLWIIKWDWIGVSPPAAASIIITTGQGSEHE